MRDSIDAEIKSELNPYLNINISPMDGDIAIDVIMAIPVKEKVAPAFLLGVVLLKRENIPAIKPENPSPCKSLRFIRKQSIEVEKI